MVFCCLFRNDQSEKKRNRFAIGRVEGNGKLRSYEHAGHCVALGHSCVRNRDPVAQSGRAQLLARHEAFQNLDVGEMHALRKERAQSVASIAPCPARRCPTGCRQFLIVRQRDSFP